jgi:Spy/CpxP family protein refolding chaperone
MATMAASLATFALPAAAQKGPGPGDGQGMRQGQGKSGPSAEKRLQHLTRQLDLSAEQQAQIRPILQEEESQLAALRAETTLSREERRSRLQELYAATFKKIRPILTPEQQQKHDDIQQRMQERRKSQSGPAPTTPPGK